MINIIMQIQKLYENHFNHNDIYILETLQNNLIINDNYHGLLQLSAFLNIEKKINIPEGTTIYFLYKKFDENNLAIYCPDQEQININNSKNNFIALHQQDKTIFSPTYYWQNDTLIFTTYDHTSYQVCFVTHTLKEISKNEIKKKYPIFFNFWNQSKNCNILTSYSEKFSFIAQENDTTIAFHNTLNTAYDKIQISEDGWHDIEYNNNIFIFVYEKKLEIIHYNTYTLLQPNSGYIFLRAKFITQTSIVILSSKPSNHNDSMLHLYQLIID